jgi:phosphoribosyl 1,2-cyclic phosphodiesterase
VLITHYHWDHILGLTVAPPTFVDEIPMHIYGPVDHGRGLRDVVDEVFRRPFFPVESDYIENHLNIHSMENFEERIMVVHPTLGFLNTTRVELLRAESSDGICCGREKKVPLAESIVIKMAPTSHGVSTCISYRFEERPTGKILVFCTDHDNMRGISEPLKEHFKDANLAIVDAQYDEEKYIKFRSQYGHGTPLGAVLLALSGGVEKLGLTHHDPMVTDHYLETVILKEAVDTLAKIKKDKDFLKTLETEKVKLKKENIFLCGDYGTYDV